MTVGKKTSSRPVPPPVVPQGEFQLIEASAGTGKTHSITTSYLRLMIGAGVRVDQILVVTYTEAARAELRDRIRSRIREVHEALTAADPAMIDDAAIRELLTALVADGPARERALRRLASGLASFDQAAIFTIHGFCNRVLADEAFAAGMDFQTEVVADDVPLLETVVADFVRQRMSRLSEPELLAFTTHCPLADGIGKGDLRSPGRLMLGRSLALLSRILNDPFIGILPAQDRSPQIADGEEAFAVGLTLELIAYARKELARRKQEAGVISYGDMLTGVWRALEGGGSLLTELRNTYIAALVDEFQDTNPLQYAIFRKIFEGTGSPVVFVGDPKQAIFGFQGGDVYAYFNATREIPRERQSTLSVNYRSAAALVRAISELFTYSGSTDIFKDGGLCGFPPVTAANADGKEPRTLPPQENRGAMHWFLLPGFDSRPKPGAIVTAFDVSVAEIADLLRHPATGETALRPGDIAVLVRTNAQGRQMQEALGEAGIPAVIRARGDVFDSDEAGELLLLLRAVADPRDDAALSAALLSPFLGYTAADVAALREDAVGYEAVVERFFDARALWADRDGGFIRMAMDLVHRRGIAADGKSIVDLLGASGERTLTNVFHLFELLHQESLLHPGTRHLVNWLERRIADAGEREKEQPLRLESDEDRVQIVTIHSSKGLEYPVVFFPLAFDGQMSREGKVAFCHLTDETGSRLVADFGSEEFDNHVALAKQERISENIRLLYVALTRARQRCYVVWGKVNNLQYAALPRVLWPGFDGSGTWIRDLAYDELTGPVRDLANRSAGGVTWSEIIGDVIAAPVSPGRAIGPEAFSARRYTAKPPQPGWSVASYTSLTQGWSRSARDRDSGAAAVARPPEGDLSIFSFPAGARTGIVWHDLFEKLDFGASDEQIRSIAAGIPRRAGARAEFAPAIASMVRAALDRPITPDGGRLRDLTDTVRELEFTFATTFRTDEVRRILQDPAHALDPLFREAAGQLAYRDVRGFMMGAIDLLFAWKGRFYLADYKSNALGSSAVDYSSDRLRETMAREHYYLQYLIYSVAVDRYLSRRVPGYSYDTHFGGVTYLFLRGIGAGEGILFDRPQRSLIAALGTAFGGESGS